MFDEELADDEEMTEDADPLVHYLKHVEQALLQERMTASDEVSVYLANALACFDQQAEEQVCLYDVILLTYHRAMTASDPLERRTLLREVGDQALFYVGYLSFGDSMAPNLASYCIPYGIKAYETLCYECVEEDREIVAEVFYDLATRFLEYTEVVSRVTNATNLTYLYSSVSGSGQSARLH
jgi:hypothetical protein